MPFGERDFVRVCGDNGTLNAIGGKIAYEHRRLFNVIWAGAAMWHACERLAATHYICGIDYCNQ